MSKVYPHPVSSVEQMMVVTTAVIA